MTTVDTEKASGLREGPEELRMQGHWLLAAMGKKVLRPGGRELTEAMLKELPIDHTTDIVEFGPGVGHTAEKMLAHNPKSYTAIDRDRNATAQVTALLARYPQASYISSDAKNTPLEDKSASLVVGEAMLTMQPEKGKRTIMSQASRILRKGGIYAIHELAFVPDTCPASVQEDVAAELRKAIKVGARPLTVKDWTALLEECGFEVLTVKKAPMALLQPRRIFSDEGVAGALKFIFNVARNRAARQRIFTMRAVFNKYADHLAGVAIIARKTKD